MAKTKQKKIDKQRSTKQYTHSKLQVEQHGPSKIGHELG